MRCEWGPVGAARVAADGAMVLIDVLSFTTSVSVLVERGVDVYPAAWRDHRARDLARKHDAALAVGRWEVSASQPWSLSPASLLRAPSPGRLVLPSPNGSTIAAAARGPVFAACLRNASAVGRRLHEEGYGTDRPVTLVPAGERWPDGSLRPALEDLLGAAAVLTAMPVPDAALSPEAVAARALFTGVDRASLADAVRECASGRELVDGGHGEDVDVAVELDATALVPTLDGGRFRSLSKSA